MKDFPCLNLIDAFLLTLEVLQNKQSGITPKECKIHKDKIVESAHLCLNRFDFVNSAGLNKDIALWLYPLIYLQLSVFGSLDFTYLFKCVYKHAGPCSEFLCFACP